MNERRVSIVKWVLIGFAATSLVVAAVHAFGSSPARADSFGLAPACAAGAACRPPGGAGPAVLGGRLIEPEVSPQLVAPTGPSCPRGATSVIEAGVNAAAIEAQGLRGRLKVDYFPVPDSDLAVLVVVPEFGAAASTLTFLRGCAISVNNSLPAETVARDLYGVPRGELFVGGR